MLTAVSSAAVTMLELHCTYSFGQHNCTRSTGQQKHSEDVVCISTYTHTQGLCQPAVNIRHIRLWMQFTSKVEVCINCIKTQKTPNKKKNQLSSLSQYMCYHSGFMLQLLLQELNCKTRTVSISYLTTQLYAVTGYFLTTIFSKHMALWTCIFSYKAEARSWPACVHGLAVPPTKPHHWLAPTWQPHHVQAITLPNLPGDVFAQPPYFGGGEQCARWRRDVVTQKGNWIHPFYAPQQQPEPCQSLPGAGQTRGAEFVPPPENAPGFPPAVSSPLFICSHAFTPAIAKLFWQ